MLSLIFYLFSAYTYPSINEWLPDVVVSEGYTSYPNQRNIVSGVSGGVHAVWFTWEGSGARYSVWYNYYTGTQWTTPQKISAPSGITLACHPCIASWLNNIYCAWENNWGCSDIVLRRFIDGNWEDTVIVISSGSKYSYTPSLVCDGQGVVHIVWEKEYEIHYRKMQGSVLSKDIKLSNSGVYAAYPGIATFGGNIFVVWEDLRDGNFEIYFKEFDGNQWSADKRVTNSDNASIFPCLCVDSSGVVHIVWQEEVSGAYKIYYTSYRQGNFSPYTLIVDSPGEAITPSITAVGDGLHLVWSDSRDGDWEIYYKNGWSDEIRLTNSSGVSANPSICANKDGSLYLLFWDDRSVPTKVYFKKKDGSKRDESVTPTIVVSPNPFIQKTVIEFQSSGVLGFNSQLPDSPTPQLKIYDLCGRLVRTFSPLTIQPFNRVVWDGTDNQGVRLKSGLYFVQVVAEDDGIEKVHKIILLR